MAGTDDALTADEQHKQHVCVEVHVRSVGRRVDGVLDVGPKAA